MLTELPPSTLNIIENIIKAQLSSKSRRRLLLLQFLLYQHTLATQHFRHRKLITTRFTLSLLTTKCKVKYHIKLLNLNQVYAALHMYIHNYMCVSIFMAGYQAVHFHCYNALQAAVYHSCQINTGALQQ